jgi:hypothetical protein
VYRIFSFTSGINCAISLLPPIELTYDIAVTKYRHFGSILLIKKDFSYKYNMVLVCHEALQIQFGAFPDTPNGK